MAHKYVYFFGEGKAEGKAEMKELLGGKGANLAEMSNLGIPVPAGFTISTEICNYFYDNDKYPPQLETEVMDALTKIEKVMGASFGDAHNPLLLSVRSGARVSMPGMMDTVLNLGLNDVTIQGLITKSVNPRFAYDSYRRFVAMFGDVVLGLKPVSKDDVDPFEEILEERKRKQKVSYDTELTADDLKELVAQFKDAIKKRTGKEFPEDPKEQLWMAIGAVFESWNNERAVVYRKLNSIPDHWGTAVNVQSMVFGNMGGDCGTGVAFTRDPATGEKRFYGEYLINAQGEDVVAGIRTPQKIAQLEKEMPEVYHKLVEVYQTLEKHYRDMQDIEFTVQNKKLWMLQTRVGKRTGFAAFRIAVDLVEEGLISKEEALMRVEPEQLNQLLRPIFDFKEKAEAVESGRLLSKGLNAGPGAACGKVVFNAADAEERAKRGEKVILVKNKTIKEGEFVSLDGATGEVIEGEIHTNPSEVLQVLLTKSLDAATASTYRTYARMMSWADEVRRLGVRANADQPDQSANSIAFGAEGIGLCRTEHMFFGGERIDAVREMILAEDEGGRRKALDKLLPIQRKDFREIFEVMKEMPVTIRTLDPPLHEFIPSSEREIEELAKNIKVSAGKLKAKVESLHEANPMLGHRGCRLGVVYPEITEMQARAILEAACEVAKKGIKVHPEIMIPLVGHVNELKSQEEVVRRVAKEVFKEQGVEVEYLVGTMIELPRAAITADEVATVAEFFSFGTNDLTQTTFGLSRDDAGKFLPYYLKENILSRDPFQAIDREGVGQLMKWGVERGRSTRGNLKIGICGEHGGEPSSVEFCHEIGMDYVSCSPFRIPVARLAAAQAALKERKEG